MAENKIVFYHPLIWNHLKRIVKNNPDVDPKAAEKINSFLTFSKEKDFLWWLGRLTRCSCPIDRTDKFNDFNVKIGRAHV